MAISFLFFLVNAGRSGSNGFLRAFHANPVSFAPLPVSGLSLYGLFRLHRCAIHFKPFHFNAARQATLRQFPPFLPHPLTCRVIEREAWRGTATAPVCGFTSLHRKQPLRSLFVADNISDIPGFIRVERSGSHDSGTRR
jgi:hypothetical protein